MEGISIKFVNDEILDKISHTPKERNKMILIGWRNSVKVIAWNLSERVQSCSQETKGK